MVKNLMVGLAMLASLVLEAGPTLASPSRVVDDNDTVVLRGNVHPDARPENDAGASDLSLPMDRMILSLRLKPAQQSALDRLIAEQQDPRSRNFHRWLTPEEFGAQFGPTLVDVAAVTDWLTSHGFSVEEVAKSRMWINFTGTVATVERAFRTQIRDYVVEGHRRHGNAQDPSIPRGLADLVGGVVTLHNFPRTPMNSGLRPLSPAEIQPDYTSGSTHYLAPGDFAAVYDVTPLYSAGVDGTGQTIAIVGRTHPSAANWTAFRSLMGLPSNAPQVVVNGPDPGDLGAGEDGEADLDVEWAGAVAKKATIGFVTSASTNTTDGVDLSAQYIVNNNLAPVMSTSFGQCESLMGATENAFYDNLWSQAAAQGITSFVASGDSGAAGCSAGSAASGSGRAVSGLSSTPYNVAVGGTQLNEGSGTYWGANNTSYASCLGYIPEEAWNESGAVSGGSGLWATGGGPSSTYAKPSWQVAPGVPGDGRRDVPDVSLTAASHDGYIVQTQGALYVIGGTSASSPSFAGLMALVVQKTGQRQGNANIRLYQLATAQYGSGGAVVFHDVTAGNNTVPGVTGFACGAGYDAATGLGSVDAAALVNSWAAAMQPDFSISAAPTAVSVARGAAATTTVTTTVSGGFTGPVSLTASGLPAGTTATFNPTSIAAPGAGQSKLTLSTGATTVTGTYVVTITATSGTKTHTTTVSLTVTASGTTSTLFSDGFEGAGWYAAQVSGTGGAWALVGSGTYPTSTPHAGVKMARFNSYTAPSGSQTRIFRNMGFAVPSTSAAVTLKFWMVHDTGYPTYNDRVQPQVSTNGTTWTNVGAAVSRYNGTTGWAPVSVDLTAYRGQTLYLGFVGMSAYGNNVFLDDVSVASQ